AMPREPLAPNEGPRVSRRSLLRAGVAATAMAEMGAMPRSAPAQEQPAPEWRNKQPGMAYRRLGRTGMMVSEVVCGGDPIHPGNYKHLNLALEMGLNYLDMAPQYGNGDCERAYGML